MTILDTNVDRFRTIRLAQKAQQRKRSSVLDQFRKDIYQMLRPERNSEGEITKDGATVKEVFMSIKAVPADKVDQATYDKLQRMHLSTLTRFIAKHRMTIYARENNG